MFVHDFQMGILGSPIIVESCVTNYVLLWCTFSYPPLLVIALMICSCQPTMGKTIRPVTCPPPMSQRQKDVFLIIIACSSQSYLLAYNSSSTWFTFFLKLLHELFQINHNRIILTSLSVASLATKSVR